MSKNVLARLSAEFSSRILEQSSFRGDDQAIVDRADWSAVCKFLHDDAECAMDFFIDLTAVDYPEREPEAGRFDVVLMLRSSKKNHRVRVKTRVADGESVASVSDLWPAANWAEREVFDMFGI